MTTVTLTLKNGFNGRSVKARLCGEDKRLIPGNPVPFSCNDGRRRLTVTVISGNLQPIPYQIDFTNAQRFNGDKHIKDVANSGIPRRFYLYIPGVLSS